MIRDRREIDGGVKAHSIVTKTIKSKSNKYVMMARRLQSKKHRDAEGLMLIEGVRLLEEAVRAKAKFAFALAQDDFEDTPRGLALAKSLCESGVRVLHVTPEVMASVSQTCATQGILAVAELPEACNLEGIQLDSSAPGILLMDVRDPGNLGTILRVCHAASVPALALTNGCTDPYSPKAVRASMGAVFNVPIVRLNEPVGAVHSVKNRGFLIVLADTCGTALPFEVDMNVPMFIVVGGEAAGVQPEIVDKADYVIRIPMPGGTESLNVAMACSMLLYEAMRQKMTRTRVLNDLTKG